jgi:hypothetical protein
VAIAKILLVVINADVNLEHQVEIASTTLMNVSAILVVMELLVSMESTDTLVIASLDLLDSIARLTSTNVPAIHAQTEVTYYFISFYFRNFVFNAHWLLL